MQDLLAVGGWAHGQTIAPQKNAAELIARQHSSISNWYQLSSLL